MPGITRPDVSAAMPDEVARTIIAETYEASSALALGRRLNMGTKALRMPALAAFPTASWVGEGDTAIKPSTVIKLDAYMINAEELAAIVRAPEQLLDDLTFDLWAQVRPAIVAAFAQKIDQAVFFGVNKPTIFPTGLVQQAIAAGNVITGGTGPDLAYDTSLAMGTVELSGYDVTGFAGGVGVRATLRNMRNADGTPIYQPALTGGTPNTLYGLPIRTIRNGTWNPNLAQLVTGDFSYLVCGVRQDITWRVSDDAVVDGISLFQTDQVALRCVMRMGWVAVNPITQEAPNWSTGGRFPFGVVTPEPPLEDSETESETRSAPSGSKKAGEKAS
jgi:HK97 family phage major capsid protein